MLHFRVRVAHFVSGANMDVCINTYCRCAQIFSNHAVALPRLLIIDKMAEVEWQSRLLLLDLA